MIWLNLNEVRVMTKVEYRDCIPDSHVSGEGFCLDPTPEMAELFNLVYIPRAPCSPSLP